MVSNVPWFSSLATAAVFAVCRRLCRFGKALGMGGVYDQETATHYIKLGARFVLTGSDHSYLLAGARARTMVLRQAP